jgi:hypothetical protein
MLVPQSPAHSVSAQSVMGLSLMTSNKRNTSVV